MVKECEAAICTHASALHVVCANAQFGAISIKPRVGKGRNCSVLSFWLVPCARSTALISALAIFCSTRDEKEAHTQNSLSVQHRPLFAHKTWPVRPEKASATLISALGLKCGHYSKRCFLGGSAHLYYTRKKRVSARKLIAQRHRSDLSNPIAAICFLIQISPGQSGTSSIFLHSFSLWGDGLAAGRELGRRQELMPYVMFCLTRNNKEESEIERANRPVIHRRLGGNKKAELLLCVCVAQLLTFANGAEGQPPESSRQWERRRRHRSCFWEIIFMTIAAHLIRAINTRLVTTNNIKNLHWESVQQIR